MPTLADVLERHGPAYRQLHGSAMPQSHRAAMRAIVACRTGRLGGHLARCADCGAEHLLFHSCCNRACPRCGGASSARWVEVQRKLLLSAPYFHVTFTLPQELRRTVRSHQRVLLAALCRAAYDALAALCRDPTFLGARIGAVAVIHTWSRTLIWHPHVHMLVPGGGLDDDGTTWRTVRRANRKDFLVPYKALASGFRTRFMKLAGNALPDLNLPQSVWHKRWVVDVKRSLPQSSERLLGYLGRYIHRTALTDKRIVAFDDNTVTFRYRDSRDGLHKLMTLPACEFIRRFLQHIPPKGMHRVRSYGLLHPQHRSLLRQVQLFALGTSTNTGEITSDDQNDFGDNLIPESPRPPSTLHCPHCGANGLQLVLRLSPDQCLTAQRARSPPNRGPPRSIVTLQLPS